MKIFSSWERKQKMAKTGSKSEKMKLIKNMLYNVFKPNHEI